VVGRRVEAPVIGVMRVRVVIRMMLLLKWMIAMLARREMDESGAVVQLGLGVAISVTTGCVLEGHRVGRTVLWPIVLLCAEVKMRLAALDFGAVLNSRLVPTNRDISAETAFDRKFYYR
jgi:hypothetical protein